MNVDHIRQMFPTDGEFASMRSLERKRRLEQILSAALDEIATEDRQPDLWERRDLAFALSCLFVGWYGAALSAAARCLTPEDGRSQELGELPGELPELTIEKCRGALDYIKGAPPAPFA